MIRINLLDNLLEKELWADVPEYGGLYKVSSLGNAKRVGSDKNLSPGVGTNGYLLVVFSKNGKTKTHYLHVQVAKLFIGERPTNKVINHKDANKHNNNATNLEYITQKENLEEAEKHGYDRTKNGTSKITKETALLIRELYAKGNITHKELGEKFGLARNTVTQILNNYLWTK